MGGDFSTSSKVGLRRGSDEWVGEVGISTSAAEWPEEATREVGGVSPQVVVIFTPTPLLACV